jgi:hypothetical protein
MKFLILFTMALSASLAQADILIEPTLGSMISAKSELGSTSGDAESISGTATGLKLAYETQSFVIGLDYTGYTYTMSDNNTFDNHAIITNSLFLAYRMRRLRLGLSYVMSGAWAGLSGAAGSVADSAVATVDGFKLGVSYELTTWFALNFDFASYNYKSVVATLSSAYGGVEADGDDVTGENIMTVGISFPFSI